MSERNIIKTLDLSEPILVVGEEVSKLEFRKPRAADLRATDASEGDNGTAIILISRLTDIPESSIELLAIEDYAPAAEFVSSFFE